VGGGKCNGVIGCQLLVSLIVVVVVVDSQSQLVVEMQQQPSRFVLFEFSQIRFCSSNIAKG